MKLTTNKYNLKSGLYCAAALAAVAVPSFITTSVHATGYVSDPPSRAYYGHTLAPDTSNDQWSATHAIYGAAMDNFQNMSSLKKFDDLTDGNLASADNSHYDSIDQLTGIKSSLIDNQSDTNWVKQDMNYGDNNIVWTSTQKQNTDKWEYWITKPNWDPNKPLTKDEFMKIGEFSGNHANSHDTDTHKVTIPDNVKAGYNVIMASWELGDQPTSYYQVIDVNVEDKNPPTVPNNLKVNDSSWTSATLSWDKSVDDHSSSVTYSIYKDNGTEPIATTKDINYELTGLEPGSTGTYTVTAKDDVGNESDHSNVATVTTLKDTEKPDTPVLHLDKAGMTTLDISWNKVADNVGVKEYKIYQDDSNGEIIGKDVTTYQATGLTPGSNHRFKLEAYDAAGNISESQVLNAQTLPDTVSPDIVENFRAESVTKNSMTLKWNEGTDNVGVVRYELVRKGNGNEDIVQNTNKTEFTDSGLTPDTSYTYTLKAYDAAGNVSEETSLTQKTAKPTINMHLQMNLTNPGEGSGHDIFEFYTVDGYLGLYTNEGDEVAKFFEYTDSDSTDYDYDSYSYDKTIDYSTYQKIRSERALRVWGSVKESDWGNGDDILMYTGYHSLNVSMDDNSLTASNTFTGDAGDGSVTFNITFTEQ
ncbi:fibronectin type III domain-containing protein [Enterococcus mundtii]|uniref:fibronectin type III domain-containing protein n=1 Tax=Enterococcus mundtii TaxID=53346 RepID=UPI00115BBDAE|nr:lytic polysaccharide monooxygenase [Enterococcus mundtii]